MTIQSLLLFFIGPFHNFLILLIEEPRGAGLDMAPKRGFRFIRIATDTRKTTILAALTRGTAFVAGMFVK